MAEHTFSEGVRPGGLTTNKETRILLCYLVHGANGKVCKEDLQEVLLGEEMVNYFLLMECLSQLEEQNLVMTDEAGFLHITEAGKTVATTLVDDLPRSICTAAVRGIIRAQQYAAKEAAHSCDIVREKDGYCVKGHITDATGTFFKLELYMPDERSAKAVRQQFVEKGDEVYKLVLAAFTGQNELAEKALQSLSTQGLPHA